MSLMSLVLIRDNPSFIPATQAPSGLPDSYLVFHHTILHTKNQAFKVLELQHQLKQQLQLWLAFW